MTYLPFVIQSSGEAMWQIIILDEYSEFSSGFQGTNCHAQPHLSIPEHLFFTSDDQLEPHSGIIISLKPADQSTK